MSYVLLLAAGGLLWFLWRRASRRSPEIRAALTTGFLIRALLGVALFFISWLELPVARSLQQPGGLWFYAMDAARYMGEAAVAASGGFHGIVALQRLPPSAFFVQILAVAIRLLGDVASIALLLNALAYLGACAAVVATAQRIGASQRATALVIAAISLSPSLILWSTQPLKDTLLTMLLVCVFMAGLAWQQVWIDRGVARKPALAIVAAAAFWLALWSIGGIRWYLALVLWLFTPILALVLIRARGRRAIAAIATLAFVIVMFSSIVVGAQWLIPHHLYVASHTVTANPATWSELPRALFDDFAATKRAFDAAPGGTDIRNPAPSTPRLERRRHIAARRTPNIVTLGATTGAEPSTVRVASAAFGVMVVPPTLARALGIFDAGGGRGLWLFADADTIAFDAVIVIAIVSLAGMRRRGESATPMLWYALAIGFTFFFLLPYSVSNYGSLFRYRSVVYVSFAVIPLVLQPLRTSPNP